MCSLEQNVTHLLKWHKSVEWIWMSFPLICTLAFLQMYPLLDHSQSIKTCVIWPKLNLFSWFVLYLWSHFMPITPLLLYCNYSYFLDFTPCGVNFSCILPFVTNGHHNLPYQCQPKVNRQVRASSHQLQITLWGNCQNVFFLQSWW